MILEPYLPQEENVEPNLKDISPDEPFRFECSSTVPCFNECCRDLNQFLTPYDIVRLKNHSDMSSGDFLKNYCSRHTGPESGLPVVSLRPLSAPQLTCPFVTTAGCSVYENRPSSCRTYPLVRVISRSRETGIINERFMVLKESHCLGFNEDGTQTVRQWVEQQGLTDYYTYNDMLMGLISLKNQMRPGPLDVKSGQIFHMALNDLDSFRLQIFDNDLLEGHEMEPKRIAAIKTDDVALLEFGIEWVQRELFGI
ncbi:MAG: YkgJ family cysteine cluster protein [Deltaproteobacteria bacterium]|jgi:Fe-S-cluster containining protein|nr:YkgJ family cysteine cluster protein [Deltaproteobacteria bacterium]